MTPLVSIVIPVYNGQNYLREAIDSALAQTYKNIEIIVVNDGSNDNGATEKIALSYGDKIRYFKKENGGVATALNMGIENMQGEYFSWLSHDDLYNENKILRQMEVLSTLEDKKTIITCGFVRVDADGKIIDDDRAADFSNEQLETPLFILLHGIMGGGLSFGCSYLIHKSHFSRVGTFNIDFMYINDIDLWFRIMRNQPIKYVREPLTIKRLHDGMDARTKVDLIVPVFSEWFLDTLKKLSHDEITQLFGSNLMMWHEVFKTYYNNEFISLYALLRETEERFKLYNAAQTKDEKAAILSDMPIPKAVLKNYEALYHNELENNRKIYETELGKSKKVYEEAVENTRVYETGLENKLEETKRRYENSTSWKITKPLRAISRIIKR